MATAPTTVPIVSVVGKGDSGKTTFLEKLIRELADRGVRVATVKHHIHDYDIDVPGKDSYRHARAGAVATMVSSPEKFALIHEVAEEMSLDAIARIAADTGSDLLITEGYKREGRNRIEVSRAERSDALICAPDEMLALVTDNPVLAEQAALAGVPVFDLNDGFSRVADLVIDRFVGEADAGGSAASSAAGVDADEGGALVASRAPGEDCPSAGPADATSPREVRDGD